MSALLEPLGRPDFIPLRNRIVMSAMTRGFADGDHRATPMMREYYRRRAEGGVGLILTEGVIVHPSGDGYRDVPHIATDGQSQSWAPVIQAVHDHGARIACQLWHCGRISHPDFTGGEAPVSSTDRAAEGVNRQNEKPYGKPRPLTVGEMPTVFGYFADAARRALDVGFDAIELHLGHGYLADQFLDARINDRTDDYGGSIENRCRFSLELLDRVLPVAGSERTIARISPSRSMGGLYDWPDLEEMIRYFIPELWRRGLRVLDISCANADYFETSGRIIRAVRPLWPGVIIGGASLSAKAANEEIEHGLVDLVTWGRAFIANPDLPKKIESKESWVEFTQEMRETLV